MIISMIGMFQMLLIWNLYLTGASAFNQDLNKWNVSNVTNMKSMFATAASLNKSLNDECF